MPDTVAHLDATIRQAEANLRRLKELRGLLQPQEALPLTGAADSGRDDVVEAVGIWNDMAAKMGLPTCQKLTDARRRQIAKRLKDAGGVEGWRIAVGKIAASPHCTGKNDRGWRADIDFLAAESSFTRTMEGRYDDRRPQGGGAVSRLYDDLGLDCGSGRVI